MMIRSYRIRLLGCFVVLTAGVAMLSSAVGVLAAALVPQLRVTLAQPISAFTLGDEIKLRYVIKNLGEQTVPGLQPYDNNREFNEAYSVSSQDESGNFVAVPENYVDSMKARDNTKEIPLAKGQQLSGEITINDWLVLRKPGKYRVKVIYSWKDYKQIFGDSEAFNSNEVLVEIKPSNPATAAAAVRKLKAELAAANADDEVKTSAIIRKLAFLGNDKADAELRNYLAKEKYWRKVKGLAAGYLPNGQLTGQESTTEDAQTKIYTAFGKKDLKQLRAFEASKDKRISSDAKNYIAFLQKPVKVDRAQLPCRSPMDSDPILLLSFEPVLPELKEGELETIHFTLRNNGKIPATLSVSGKGFYMGGAYYLSVIDSSGKERQAELAGHPSDSSKSQSTLAGGEANSSTFQLLEPCWYSKPGDYKVKLLYLLNSSPGYVVYQSPAKNVRVVSMSQAEKKAKVGVLLREMGSTTGGDAHDETLRKLCRLGAPEAIKPLIEVLYRDNKNNNASWGKFFAYLPQQQLLSELTRAAEQRGVASEMTRADWSLVKSPIREQLVLKSLSPAMQDFRSPALYLAQRYPSPAYLSRLAEFALAPGNDTSGYSAVYSLGSYPKKYAYPILQKVMGMPDASRRQLAQEYMKQLKTKTDSQSALPPDYPL